jgi:hypothetical protein
MTPSPEYPLFMVNFNTASMPLVNDAMQHMIATGQPTLSKGLSSKEYYGVPIEGVMSLLLYPVFDSFSYNPNRRVIGCLSTLLAWTDFFDNNLPDGQDGIEVVVTSCSSSSTFSINGGNATFRGSGDLHNTKYDDMGMSDEFVTYPARESTVSTVSTTGAGQCQHRVSIYPTTTMEAKYITNDPIIYAISAVLIFVFATTVFLVYDWFVSNRQSRTEMRAEKSSAIVQELFPGDVATQLFEQPVPSKAEKSTTALARFEGSQPEPLERSTIAEMYPETTVLCTYTVSSPAPNLVQSYSRA